MKVSKLKLFKEKNAIIYSAVFSFGFFKRKKIWFRIPNFVSLDSSPDNAFFVLSYVMSLVLGEDLYFEGVVSRKLNKNIKKINKHLGFSKRKIKINVTRTIHEEKKGKAIAQFFTLGVDSFYTLINKRREIQYLIFVDGFDVPIKPNKLKRIVHKGIKNIALKTNSKAIFMSTNIREISDRIMNWELFHGTALASAGLLFSPAKKIYINSSEAYLFNTVYGTGPKVDRLWTTERISFIPHGSKVSRIKKIEALVKSDMRNIVLKNLRACWKNVYNKRYSYNCSRCEKCVRTQLGFIAYGIESFPTFKKLSDYFKEHFNSSPCRAEI